MGNCVQCNVSADCPAGDVCVNNLCLPPTCSDGMQDGSETGVDCGGPLCPPCQAGQGCNVDTDCFFQDWCNETARFCQPKLPNGLPLPVDLVHGGALLNGQCNPAAAQVACMSGVCDVVDNLCGYASNDGPCTLANGATVCRSGACSPIGLCL
jgi:hypothetical protein